MKILIRVALLAWLLCTNSLKATESIAFYYDSIDSVRELINYDRVVVEPANISSSQISTLHKAGTKVFAYLSVGEYSGDTLPNNLINAKRLVNDVWKSDVMDLSDSNWQEYLFNQATLLLDKEFDGLFLDTLDSYQLFAKKPQSGQIQSEPFKSTQLQNIKKQETALVKIINYLDKLINKKTSGGTRLILNRGFDVLDRLKRSEYVVVAESLYQEYSPIKKTYFDVKAIDSEWLENKLAQIKNKDIEVVVIDYINEFERDKQRIAAKRLLNQGYTPYVADGELSSFGISTIEPIAKRILGFYDGATVDETHSQCHRLLAMALEYLGYVPECVDVHSFDFDNLDVSRYAGLYFWLSSDIYRTNKRLLKFVKQLIGVKPLLFVGDVPESSSVRKKLGLSADGILSRGVKVLKGSEYFVRGIPQFSPFDSYPRWHISKEMGKPLVVLSDESNNTSDNYIIAKWGGVIFSPLPVISSTNTEQADKWLVDRFDLLKKTLQLSDIPVSDVTTESGRRIMTSHIDGDGFPSQSVFLGRPYAAEIILDKILKKYNLPQTVSIIEGEISREGLYPKLSSELENIAREIFKLPNVEVASHTFSHPFYWDFSGSASNKQYGEHLAIPGYKLDLKREILGSVDYINRKLVTNGKKVKVILWSGNADPTEQTVAISDDAGLLNVNGGNTFTIDGEDDYREIWPAIKWYPNAVQVYAATLNENVFTNLWTENFDGYRRVIETFRLLGEPRRIKPISVYYHMYSGTYPVTLESLNLIYDWAATQRITNLFLSEYAIRARSLYETGIARTLDGNWQITSTGVRSVRVPKTFGLPNSNKSSIYGWQEALDGRYLSLPIAKSIVSFKKQRNKQLRLNNANAQINQWRRTGNSITWQFNAHMPLEFEVSNVGNCKIKLREDDQISRKIIGKDVHRYNIRRTGVISGTFVCPGDNSFAVKN